MFPTLALHNVYIAVPLCTIALREKFRFTRFTFHLRDWKKGLDVTLTHNNVI